MKYELITVTPQMASGYLATNDGNRRVRKSHVAYFAGLIERGEWLATHQGIALSSSGRLLDGQHRLLAVVETGRAVPFMVAFDVPDETFTALDTGLIRNVSDVLSLPKSVASVALALLRVCVPYVGKTPPQRVRQVVDAVGDLINDVIESTARKRLFSTSAIQAAAVYAILNGEDKARVLGILKDLSAHNFSGLPSVASSFVRFKLGEMHSVRAKISKEHEEFLRAFDMFTFEKANQLKIQLTDPQGRIFAARKQLAALLGVK
jgi:hypothetical protein